MSRSIGRAGGKDKALEVLDIFIDSADGLLKSRFLEQVTADGIKTTLQWQRDGLITTARTGPDNEAVKAFILTLRFFCQDNEDTSIRKLNKRIQDLPIDPALKSAFSASRDSLNTYLDDQSSFVGLADADSRRGIFVTFTYGQFAHANSGKRRRLEQWKQSGVWDDLRAEYDAILLGFLRHLRRMRDICLRIRQELRTAS